MKNDFEDVKPRPAEEMPVSPINEIKEMQPLPEEVMKNIHAPETEAKINISDWWNVAKGFIQQKSLQLLGYEKPSELSAKTIIILITVVGALMAVLGFAKGCR